MFWHWAKAYGNWVTRRSSLNGPQDNRLKWLFYYIHRSLFGITLPFLKFFLQTHLFSFFPSYTQNSFPEKTPPPIYMHNHMKRERKSSKLSCDSNLFYILNKRKLREREDEAMVDVEAAQFKSKLQMLHGLVGMFLQKLKKLWINLAGEEGFECINRGLEPPMLKRAWKIPCWSFLVVQMVHVMLA